MHGRRALVPLLAAVLVATLASAAAPTLPSAAWILDQVRILSAPEMEGRGSGTQGADRAAAHISRVFQEAGLKPGGDGSGFLQAFSVATGTRLGAPNTLAQTAPASRALTLGTDFVPLGVSADGSAAGELVFAGYGITAPALGYDDYAAVDARGKVVVVLTREPRTQGAANPFGRSENEHYGDQQHKIINAREHGARAILLVNHPGAERDQLPRLWGTSAALGLPALAITRAAADTLLAPAGKRVTELADAIDRALTPHSLAVPAARVAVEVALLRQRAQTANVIGILPGTDPALRSEAIVIGAHYDHLGRGGQSPLALEQNDAIYHGADDNASGTAVVLALARAFAGGGGAPRTLVFAAFSGEEMGLLGSAHYVKNPAWPLDRTALMLNLDMVGRLRDERLWVSGVESGRDLRALVTDAARGLPLRLELGGDPWGPSDHSTFYRAGKPVLFFFTGVHEDYHRPRDTADKINGPGLATVTALAARVISAVAAAPSAPQYVKLEAPAGHRRAGGAFFGIVADFGDSQRAGVQVGDVRPGSPADASGVRVGDLIVKFAGVEVKTLEDLLFILRARRAGDRVDVVLVREGRERRVEATLVARP